MEINYIAFAVPLFFAGIALELWVARRRRKEVYRFHDAIADLGCGIAQQVEAVFVAATLLAGYAWVRDHYQVVQLPQGPVPWIVAFVGVDFLYYWWHRLSHEVNFLWAGHVVHHQSEDYNLAVALRQSIFTSWTALPFYLPLALLGVPPVVYATIHSFSTLYQFWIHTQLVGTLGPLEWILNTPSHHRVHHGQNAAYLDKNYGATFIIWDRLFGTFAEEREPVVYGVVKPLASFNPLWAQFEYLVKLARTARDAPRRRDKLKVWLKGPAWSPEGLDAPPAPATISPETFRKYDPQMAAGLKPYLTLHYALAVAATTLMLLLGRSIPTPALVVLAALTLLTLLTSGGLSESRRWALPVEVVRLALLAGAVAAWRWGDALRLPVVVGAVAATALMALWVARSLRSAPAIGHARA